MHFAQRSCHMAAFESSPAVAVNIQERERIIRQMCASSCFELVGGCVLLLMQEVRVSCAGNLKNVLSENEARVQGEKHEKKQKGIRGKKKDTKDRMEGGEVQKGRGQKQREYDWTEV